ncbi:MAG: hypothetical protein PF542_07030 [Nanoarchaeota archaeon]|jgi:hypothetical protein|nr:hypothetical protein [Nanoarchaeota archaeon]
MTSTEENLIHLKLDYSQAKDAKKHILSSEINLLKITQSIKKYKKLRLEELKQKEKIASKLKSTRADILSLQKLMPKVKIPKILIRKDEPQSQPLEENGQKITRYGTVEDQLRKIQRKLKDLEEH